MSHHESSPASPTTPTPEAPATESTVSPESSETTATQPVLPPLAPAQPAPSFEPPAAPAQPASSGEQPAAPKAPDAQPSGPRTPAEPAPAQPSGTQPLATHPPATHPPDAHPTAHQAIAQHLAAASEDSIATPEPQPSGGDSGGPPAAPPRSPRERRFWPAVVGTAAASALVASLATAGILGARDAVPASSPTTDAATETTQVTQRAPLENPQSWQDVVEHVADSVVAIQVRSGLGGAEGSGVIFDAEGLILTNHHVVEGGERGAIDVVLADGRVLGARVLGSDETTDLAVLRLVDPPSDLVAAELGDSDSLRVGQAVMAVGNPLGLAGTVTTGIVSALDRPTVTEGSREAVITNAIQVDAAVNPGNSGGPLFDFAGRVVGINSSIATLSGGSRSGSIGLGFAIPVNLAKMVAEQIVETGTVSHAFLGVSLADGTAEVDGVERQGAVVGQVVEGSPAEGAGVQVGDVITAIDGKPVASGESLTGYIRARAVGQEARLTIVREGEQLELSVTLAARDEPGRVRG